MISRSTNPDSDAAPRVGVFLCRCGDGIEAVLDLSGLAEEAARMPGVVRVQVDAYPCAGRGLVSLKEAVKTHGIDRVVVAGCTPRTHRPGFRRVLKEMGIHPAGFEMVNLREHCAWAHRQGGPPVQEKARDLLRMGVARSLAWKPSDLSGKPVVRTAAVIGAGISGITAAGALAARGFHVFLLEKEDQAGGLLGKLGTLYPSGKDPAVQVQKKLAAIRRNPGVDLRTGTSIDRIERTHTGYRLYLESGGNGAEALDVSLVLLATGARPLAPSELAGWESPGVVSLLDLEGMLREGTLEARHVVMVLCAGARCDRRPYCARFCCMAAVKNARLLREHDPACAVTVLYRDLSVNCMNPRDIKDALSEGVRFVRFDPAVPPRPRGNAAVFRSADGTEDEISCDLVVPVTPMVPLDETRRLAGMIGLPADAHGFVVERQVKLKPEWPVIPGAAVAGSAHWPCSASEAARQAMEAAAGMARWLDEAADAPEAVRAAVDIRRCIGCGLCADVCPFNAAALTTVDNEQKAFIAAAACRGCGICSAGCPALAITLQNHTDAQLRAQIRALSADKGISAHER
ncbi:MAG: CoB--CoM heterodisulfide reductase iron-sulfur subunit A family protein [Deltaproteobacteria bacterium]|nr:CoB--CoM heterodisulfide reductase iron-sulfur subunit A family protein [Deltaproteobacteria bacterium]